MQIQGEHANRKNKEPSCFEVTVITTAETDLLVLFYETPIIFQTDGSKDAFQPKDPLFS